MSYRIIAAFQSVSGRSTLFETRDLRAADNAPPDVKFRWWWKKDASSSPIALSFVSWNKVTCVRQFGKRAHFCDRDPMNAMFKYNNEAYRLHEATSLIGGDPFKLKLFQQTSTQIV